MIGLCDVKSLQEVGIYLVAGMGPGETGLSVERPYPHLPHEGAHMGPSNGVIVVSEFVPHAP